MCEFDGEFAVGRELEEFAGGRGEEVAGAVVLEPPFFFGELVEGIDGGVGVRVGGARVSVFAVHALGPSGGVGGGQGCEGGG